jgi:hypothetical protein
LQPKRNKDIDLLFYGALSERRAKALKGFTSVRVVQKILGQPMRDLLSRTKTIVNIHYYNESPLEIFRINEALSHHCNVISEYSTHGDEFYKDVVKFGNLKELNELAMNHAYTTQDISKFCNFTEVENAIKKL